MFKWLAVISKNICRNIIFFFISVSISLVQINNKISLIIVLMKKFMHTRSLINSTFSFESSYSRKHLIPFYIHMSMITSVLPEPTITAFRVATNLEPDTCWCFVAWSSFLFRRAQSSNVSAASYLPWRRYRAPRFFNVVLTVGESTLAALCHAPYSLNGVFSRFWDLFSSRSSASCVPSWNSND